MIQMQTIGQSIGIKRGSHELPRFIYHLTSRTNYSSIVSSGAIKPFCDNLFNGRGVFAIDLVNLFKR